MNETQRLRNKAKKLKIPLTFKRGNRRIYRTNKFLLKEINKKKLPKRYMRFGAGMKTNIAQNTSDINIIKEEIVKLDNILRRREEYPPANPEIFQTQIIDIDERLRRLEGHQ